MNPLSIKLNDDNFLSWKKEALGEIKESNLEKFINETDFGGRPNKFIKEASEDDEDDAGKLSINEEFKNWEKQDQVLRVWLLVSMSPKLSIQMLQCEHAFEVWKKIQDHFVEEIEMEEQHKKMKSLKYENSMLTQRLRSLAEECLEICNENDVIEEELVKKYGPESIADILFMKPGPSGSA